MSNSRAISMLTKDNADYDSEMSLEMPHCLPGSGILDLVSTKNRDQRAIWRKKCSTCRGTRLPCLCGVWPRNAPPWNSPLALYFWQGFKGSSIKTLINYEYSESLYIWQTETLSGLSGLYLCISLNGWRMWRNAGLVMSGEIISIWNDF